MRAGGAHHLSDELTPAEVNSTPIEGAAPYKGLKQPGTVKLHVCRLAAMTFDVDHVDLLAEVDSIMDPAVFLQEVARRANHCQYFEGVA